MRRVGAFLGRHRWWTGAAAGLVAVVGAGGWFVWSQVNVPDIPVLYVVPTAQQLSAGSDETIYRVHPTRSTVSYEVEEQLAGATRTAVGTTNGIAGDVALNGVDASASRFGEIVVDVSQLTSDETLRDRRIRHDFLESGDYPLARFVPDTVQGLPASPQVGESYEVTVPGELTVKTTTAPVTLTGTAGVTSDGELRLAASADTLMSTFGIGPIELLGFVRTADEVRLNFDIVFVDPSTTTLPTTTRATEVELVATGEGPSFRDEVLPVLETRCASCHNDGGVGSMVWQLDTAGDATEIASGLGLVVDSGFMPPWPSSNLSAAFEHDRSLTDAQIAAVVAWAEAGGQLDVDPETPVTAPGPDIPPVRADLVLTAPEPYAGSPARRDDYRCFVMDPKVTQTTWVGGWEFLADQTEIVHHAIGSLVPAASRAGVEARDAADDGPGWYCGDLGMGGSNNQFIGWAPGQVPMRYRDGAGLRVEPGDVIVLQIHYHYAHSAPADLSKLHLELLPPGSDPRPVTQRVMLAPAEIPCRPGLEEGPLCDRAAAVEDIRARFGFGPSFIPDSLARGCGSAPASFMAAGDTRPSASCVHTIRNDAEAISVFGHMHEIGEAFRMTLNPGTPQERILLDIPVWDFGWQIDYQFREPVELSRGDKILVECSWDRAHLKVPEPRYITWSEGTVDEMCYSGLTLVPRRSPA